MRISNIGVGVAGASILLIAVAGFFSLKTNDSEIDSAIFNSPKTPEPIVISDVETYWLIGVPSADSDDITICVPAVSFRIKNTGDEPISTAAFNATFVNPNAATVFGGGQTYLLDAVQGNLPKGYARSVAVTSKVGRSFAPRTCTPQALPALKVSVSVTINGSDIGALIDAIPVNNNASQWYVNSMSMEEPNVERH